MADMIEDIEKSGGGEAGQAGLPTPAQIEAAEKHFNDQLAAGVPRDQIKPFVPAAAPAGQQPAAPAQPAAAPDPNALKPPAFIPEGFDLDALIKKVEDGIELSDEEKVIHAAIEQDAKLNPPPPPPDEKKYKIADKEYTREEFEAKWREEVGIGAVDVKKEVMDNILDNFHKGLNKTEFSTATGERAKEVARLTQEQELKRTELAHREQAIAQKETLHKQTVASLLAEGQRIRKLLEDPVYAGLTEETIKDEMGNVDVVKASRFVNKDTMERNLQTIVADLKKYEDTEKAIQAERATFQVQNFIELIAPQYKTEGGDVISINERINNGDATVSKQDRVKVLELHQIFREAQVAGISPAEVYELRKMQRTLAVAVPLAQTNGTTAKPQLPALNPIERKSNAARLKAWYSKYSGAPLPNGGSGGGSGQRGDAGDKRPSQAIIEADAAVLKTGGNDPFLNEIKY